jgi:nitrogen regulatory protein PII 1
MKMIRAIVRPEKVSTILDELSDAGFPAVTKMEVVGRGKQRGVKVGNIHYDQLPKEVLLIVAEDENKDTIVKIIMKNAKSGDAGAFGDGKVFVHDVDEAYTISSGEAEL